jgi:hypothetical protein
MAPTARHGGEVEIAAVGAADAPEAAIDRPGAAAEVAAEVIAPEGIHAGAEGRQIGTQAMQGADLGELGGGDLQGLIAIAHDVADGGPGGLLWLGVFHRQACSVG